MYFALFSILQRDLIKYHSKKLISNEDKLTRNKFFHDQNDKNLITKRLLFKVLILSDKNAT
ncbi:hypothetical protein BpHYR1_002161 [Brachionus plicatilis]|uniref:Uncharacterized protein n=1 Tax=Brachionus plicatilis TaxID=10195 RepID=A0A3M7QH28_BRAPC|nr:hypothetical protein BpHYR1_002161 [Brachionus plicatilis]